jgi:hypothetical protein
MLTLAELNVADQRAIDGNTPIQVLKEWQQKSLIYLSNEFLTEPNLTASRFSPRTDCPSSASAPLTV